MELFAITCTTCKSRLRVRDQAAVGQILACPKCGGMVMVKPPPAWSEAGEQKSDLPTATEVEGPALKFNQTLHSSAFDVLEDLFSDAPPKVQPPVAGPPSTNPQSRSKTPTQPQAPKPRFIGGPPAHRSTTPTPHRSATPPATPQKPAVSPTTATVPFPLKANPPRTEASNSSGGSTPGTRDAMPPPPPPPAEANAALEATTKRGAASPSRKYWLLMAGSTALGVLLAFAAVSAAIHFLRPASVAKALPTRSTPKSAASKSESMQPVPEESTTTPTPETEAATSVASTSAVTPSAAVNENTATPAPTTPEPKPLDLVKNPPPADTASVDPLAKFNEMIRGATVDPLTNATVQTSPPPPLPPADATPARPLAPRPPLREIDVAKRLADPLTAIETAGTPLADFAQLLSDLSTIPITLDVPFLPATPQSAVVLNVTNTTVGKALAEGLRTLRLEYVVEGDQLLIRRPEPSVPTAFPLPVKDLTAGDPQQMNDLAELLMAVIEPGSWSENESGGSITVDASKGTLVVTHRRAVQFQVLLAIEKLRAARTPPLPHDSKLDASFFKLDTRSALAKARLENSISLNFSQPTRLVTILERLGEAAGVRILVDWRDAASAGWNPAGEATLVASNQPLAAALDSLLDPLDLTWRIIDAQTLQVVTPARLTEQGELELYRVGNLLSSGLTAEALLAQLRAALGETAFTSGTAAWEIRLEPDSNGLLAWLPQPKQRELELLLARPPTEPENDKRPSRK